MMQMGNAAANQAVEIGKERLREFLQNNEMARNALAVPANGGAVGGIRLDALDANGKRANGNDATDDDDF